jgi:hypothetical protein
MSNRYDQAVNYWGEDWGGRNQVVVAINGSFHEPGLAHLPASGQIHSGWYSKRFDDCGGGSGFVWTLDRNAFIGESVIHRANRQTIAYPSLGTSQPLDGVNIQRKKDMLVLFTPQYDSHTGNNDKGVEVLVEMSRPTSVLPRGEVASGVVRDIRQGPGSGTTTIPFDHVVLSGQGTAVSELAQLKVGDFVEIYQEITHVGADPTCQGSVSPYFDDAYASISGDPVFLKKGVVQSFTNPELTTPDPRTAIAYNDQYIYFIVVDGRSPGLSAGMSLPELGQFAKNRLGAAWAINQDGGGSSTMVINGLVVNNTYCNNTVCDLPKSSAPDSGDGALDELPADEFAREALTPLALPTPDGRSAALLTNPVFLPQINRLPNVQRPVANGLMMVVAHPLARSNALMPGDDVITTGSAYVRLGPGSNFPSQWTVPIASRGVVQPHLNGLEGVLAKGTHWWKVDFGSGVSGWVQQESLIKYTTTSPALRRPDLITP